MIFEPISYRDAGIADYSSYPLGTVIMSARDDIDPTEWLQCNGSYINQSEYPLLAEFLGKHSPGVEDAIKLTGDYTGIFSTSYKYNGYIWVYWFNGKSLLGFPINEGEIKQISVTNEFDFVEDVDAPVILSICGGRVFLCQTEIGVPCIHIYSAEFDNINDDISIVMTKTISSINTSGIREYNLYIPEVVFVKNYNIDNTNTEDCFMLMAYSNFSSGEITYYALIIKSSDLESTIIKELLSCAVNGSYSNYGDKQSSYVSSLFRFNHKTANDCIIMKGVCPTSSSYSSSFGLISKLTGIYNSSIDINSNSSSKEFSDPILVSPIASPEFFIYRAYIHDQCMYIRAGSIDNFELFEYDNYDKNKQKIENIKLSPFAELFPDSMEYIESHNMFIIFVGTGIYFSHTPLDMNSWGYFDTTEYFGIISKLGNAEFDIDTNTLCLSGLGSEGNFVCGKLRLHERFDYSNDGAWLPYIVSNGVPAFIKTTEANTIANTLKFIVESDDSLNPNSSSSLPLNNYFAVVLNDDQLIHNKKYTRIIPDDTEYFNIGIKCIQDTSGTSSTYNARLYVNGSYLTKLTSSKLNATINVALRWKDFNGTVKLELKNDYD